MEHGYGGHPYPSAQQQFAAAPPPPALHGAPPPPPQFPQPGSQAFFAPPPMQFAYPSVPYPFVPPPAAPLQPPSHVPQGFFNPWEPPPPIVPPPADTELQKRIEKLVEYAAKNGPEFEKMLKEKQKDNPAYAFLFGAEGHNYYRYKLWITVNPHLGGFSTPMPPLNPALPPLNPALSPALSSFNPPLAPLNPTLNSPLNTSLNAPLPSVPGPPNPVFPPFYDQQQLHHHHQQPPPSQPYFEPVPQETYEETGSKPFKGLSGPLPTDVAAELQGVLENLTGTKESIKGAKNWFMQRSPFAPALAEALRDRVLALDDDIRQLHVIYLANDILFDSLQRRINLKEPDNEALAFQPVLGPMLAAIYHNPQNKEANQTRLQKILQFWGSKEVYNREIISALENEMIVRPPVGYRIPLPLSAPQPDHSSLLPSSNSTLLPPSSLSLLPLPGSAAGASLPLEPTIGNEQTMVSSPEPSQTAHSPSEQEHRPPLAALSAADQYGSTPGVASLATQQFVANSVPTVYPALNPSFLNSLSTSTPSTNQPTLAQLPSMHAGDHPPYPLFPPGLIPGMVRKMQIGSGVPYSPLSPLDIPAVIPPSTASDSYILDRVTKFFKEIGEVDPLEGQSKGAVMLMDEDEKEEKERSRIGGACIPPPANLHVDVETNTLPDGSMEHKPGSVSTGRLGLGAVADPNEVTQYDDVYTSYRKQRSTNYHTSMSARAAAR